MRHALAMLAWVLFAHLLRADDLQPTGFLRADVTVTAPVSLDGTTVITSHLVNICPSPVRIGIGELNYQPVFVHFALMESEADVGATDVWGPPIGEILIPKQGTVQVSGVGKFGEIPNWPDREGFVLMKDEGYARKIIVLPNWATSEDIPQTAKHLVVIPAQTFDLEMPAQVANTVQPGKSVVFGPRKETYAPSARAVPFSRRAPKPVASPVAPEAASSLSLDIETPTPVIAGQDLPVIYLIGNPGTKPVWIEQNRLIPAFATWEILKEGKVIATIDGSIFASMIALLPARPAIPLNPGEYLTFRRVLLASALPLKRGGRYQLRVRLDAPCAESEPLAEIALPVVSLSGSSDVRTQ